MSYNINERSKYLALILRHKPEIAKVEIKEDGWVNVHQLIKNTDFTLSELKTIVSTDAKNRYSFDETYTRIRANQGHSVDVRMDFKKFTPTDFLYHGTAKRFLNSIMKQGLDKKSRQYVHLSRDIDTAIKVGQRHGEPVVLKIDAVSMNNDGISFFISENGVILTDNIDVKYITPMYV